MMIQSVGVRALAQHADIRFDLHIDFWPNGRRMEFIQLICQSQTNRKKTLVIIVQKARNELK